MSAADVLRDRGFHVMEQELTNILVIRRAADAEHYVAVSAILVESVRSVDALQKAIDYALDYPE